MKKGATKKKSGSKDAFHATAAVQSKVDSFKITMRTLREMAEKEAKLVQCALSDMENNLIDPKHILDLTKSIHGTGERSITEYINRNTEILLNEHASVIRQQVIEDMKTQMQKMSDDLTLEAQQLENNISSFFDLIETSYHSASANFHKVIELAQENYQKEKLLNETKDELFSLQSEVQKLEEDLLECLMCYAFIDTLFPFAEDGKKLALPKDFLKSFGPFFSPEEKASIQKGVLNEIMASGDMYDPIEVHIESSNEIIKMIDRLKDSNLSLVHNSHLNKGSLKLEKTGISEVKQKMEEDLEAYDSKIAAVEEEIVKAKEIQEKLREQLHDMQENETVKEALLQKEQEMKKLAELYCLCTGSEEKNVDIFLMKSSIEYFLEDLFNELNKHPKKRIKELIKVLESEKKLRERKAEEALRAERLQKRLQRQAKSTTKKGFK